MRRLSVTDFGQTIRLGEYEVAAEALPLAIIAKRLGVKADQIKTY